MKHKDIKVENPVGKKMYFLAEDTISPNRKEKESAVVSINKKFGILAMGRSSVINLGLNNMWMKMYYDPVQKSIAWKVKGSVNQEELKDGWKMVKLDKHGHYKRSVIKLLNQMLLSEKKNSFNHLEVKRYKDYTQMLSDDYYYVELK